jgi:hypothetical protein
MARVLLRDMFAIVARDDGRGEIYLADLAAIGHVRSYDLEAGGLPADAIRHLWAEWSRGDADRGVTGVCRLLIVHGVTGAILERWQTPPGRTWSVIRAQLQERSHAA